MKLDKPTRTLDATDAVFQNIEQFSTILKGVQLDYGSVLVTQEQKDQLGLGDKFEGKIIIVKP